MYRKETSSQLEVAIMATSQYRLLSAQIYIAGKMHVLIRNSRSPAYISARFNPFFGWNK